MKILRLSSKLLILAVSASMVLSALGATPAFAGHDPAPALQGLHAPGGTGKITGNSYLFRPVKIASIQVAMANGTRVSETRFVARGAQVSCPPNLCYNGGPVQASPHVYLVFWGLWWYCGRNCGNCPTSCGNADSLKVENYLYNYWHQVGQRGESWATITSQYYDKVGQHPAFGQGVWGTGCAADGNCGWVAWRQDPPTTSPTVAELGNFASGMANYFRIGADPNAQIVVLTPQSYMPAGPGNNFPAGEWCAYHTAVASFGNLPFTVMPWLPDATNFGGLNNPCDANFNSLGADLNGWSKVGGHEFAETVTDPVPNTGYINPNDTNNSEIGDKCNDKKFTETMPNGQKFAQQELWSNLDSQCVQAQPAGAIKGYNSLCIDNAGGRTTDGNKIQIYTCNGGSSQYWTYTLSSGHLLVNGGCLDVSGTSHNRGTKVIRYHCTSGDNQKWSYDSSTQQWKVFGGILGIGEKCLDDPGSSSLNGTQLQIWDCNSSTAQKWTQPGG